jgi:hypothetical protein
MVEGHVLDIRDEAQAHEGAAGQEDAVKLVTAHRDSLASQPTDYTAVVLNTNTQQVIGFHVRADTAETAKDRVARWIDQHGTFPYIATFVGAGRIENLTLVDRHVSLAAAPA